MPATLIQILKVDDLAELKTFGAYLKVKNNVESQLGFKLGVHGWTSLLNKIKQLNIAVQKHQHDLLSICQNDSFKEAKAQVFELLGIKIAVKNKAQLTTKLDTLIECFSESSFDPFQRFEETKLQNFRSSSKLEGIDIPDASQTASLDSILAKYQS